MFITAHDWYEYHDKADIIPRNRQLLYFILQIFVLLALNQMLVHSVDLSMIWWFIYGIIFSLFNVVWNIITPYENHWLYVGISASLSLMASLLAGFYSKILNLLPFAFDGRWIILLIVIIFLTITIIFERIIDR